MRVVIDDVVDFAPDAAVAVVDDPVALPAAGLDEKGGGEEAFAAGRGGRGAGSCRADDASAGAVGRQTARRADADRAAVGFEGEALLRALRDVAVSSGSACTTASLEPSYVLTALGLDDELAHGSIRFGRPEIRTTPSGVGGANTAGPSQIRLIHCQTKKLLTRVRRNARKSEEWPGLRIARYAHPNQRSATPVGVRGACRRLSCRNP